MDSFLLVTYCCLDPRKYKSLVLENCPLHNPAAVQAVQLPAQQETITSHRIVSGKLMCTGYWKMSWEKLTKLFCTRTFSPF